MKYLFSDMGLQLLESLSFTKTLYAFDFDGTIAPIAPKPDLAEVPDETGNLLNQFSKIAPVTVISGRSVLDLKKRIKLQKDRLIGNHGLEGLGYKKETLLEAREVCKGWRKQLESLWGPLQADKGVFIEDKTYSLALHYRRSRNRKRARFELFSCIEKLDPAPREISGKCVVNLIPSGCPHKGVALLEALQKLDLKCAFYIGDDDTDEDVFSLPDSRVISVRVGQKQKSQAQFFLKRQSEMNRLLRTLIQKNERQSA